MTASVIVGFEAKGNEIGIWDRDRLACVNGHLKPDGSDGSYCAQCGRKYREQKPPPLTRLQQWWRDNGGERELAWGCQLDNGVSFGAVSGCLSGDSCITALGLEVYEVEEEANGPCVMDLAELQRAIETMTNVRAEVGLEDRPVCVYLRADG